MRKLFFWFGLFAAVVTFVAVMGFGYLVYKGTSLDRESKSYASVAVVAITSHWNSSELLDRASPNLRNSVTTGQISSMFDWFSVLGPLTKTQECQGSSSVVAFLGKPSSTLAQYTCKELYQQGAATVAIALVKIGDVWMVNGFHVNSPVLATHKPMQKS